MLLTTLGFKNGFVSPNKGYAMKLSASSPTATTGSLSLSSPRLASGPFQSSSASNNRGNTSPIKQSGSTSANISRKIISNS